MKLPHISKWERLWVRRLMIVVSLPWELFRASYTVLWHAHWWWVLPENKQLPDGNVHEGQAAE